MSTETIFAEIIAERQRQDAKWGGPHHDDTHFHEDWVAYIQEHADKAIHYDELSECRFRRRMIEVAALAVAAIETHDRRALALGRGPAPQEGA